MCTVEHHSSCISRCFPHIVNLACHAVLGAITDLDFAAENSVDFVPNEDQPAATLEEALKRDPVATTRSLIRGVSSSLHQGQCIVLTLS